MAVSLTHLARERKDAARRYTELAVFPPGHPIPVPAVATLWKRTGGLDASQSRWLLTILKGKSLLRLRPGAASGPLDQTQRAGMESHAQRSAPPRFLEETAGASVTLHDLQWDYLQLARPNRARLHRQMVAAYEEQYSDRFQAAPDGDYIIERASMHLAAAGARTKLYRLIDLPWFARKFSNEALRRSFIDDVDCVIQLARKRGARDLDQLVRACLIRGSIDRVAVDAPPAAIFVLARCGEIERVVDAAMLGENPWSQMLMYSSAARGLWARGMKDEAGQLALLAAVHGAAIEYRRADALAWVADLLAELGHAQAQKWVRRAWAACRTQVRKSEYDVARSLTRTALAAFKSGRVRDARRMMGVAQDNARRSVGWWDFRDETFLEVIEGWIRVGERQGALRLVKDRLKWVRRHRGRTTSPEAPLLAQAALACARSQCVSEAERLWAQARRARRRPRNFNLASYGLEISARLGRPADAVRWIRRSIARTPAQGRKGLRAEAYALAAVELSATGRRREAGVLARQALRSLRAVSHPVSARRDRSEMEWELDTLTTVAEALARSGDQARALPLALEALARTTAFQWNPRRSGDAKGAIAAALAEQGRHARAHAIAADIADSFARDMTFRKLVRALAIAGRYGAAVSVAARIDKMFRSEAIEQALTSVPRSRRARAAPALLPAVTEDRGRARVLCWLARHTPVAWLEAAQSAYARAPSVDAAVSLAHALRQHGEHERATALADERWRALATPTSAHRMEEIEGLARLLAATGERGKTLALIDEADRSEDLYRGSALGRTAWVFAEAGWGSEAEQAARRAVARSAPDRREQRYGAADALMRVAHAREALDDRAGASEFAQRAFAALGQASSSVWDAPEKIRRALGMLLGRIMAPEAALVAICAKLPGWEARDSIAALHEQVRSKRGVRAADGLEKAIASRHLLSGWLVVRMASARHRQRDFARARALLIQSLDLVSRGDGDVLDVIEQGACVFGTIDRGRMLERLHAVIVDIEGWSSSGRADAADARRADVESTLYSRDRQRRGRDE
jgi:tetratricopeptide (TPR) repeat protein